MKRWIGFLACLTLLAGAAPVSADLVSRNITALINQDFTVDTEHRDGLKPPGEATLTCDDSEAPSLLGLVTGAGEYSEDVRSYYGGSAAGTCSLGLFSVSGDDAATKLWALDGNLLENPRTNPGSIGSGFLRIGCTTGGNTKFCSDRAWNIAAPPTDTTDPTVPINLACEPGTNQLLCSWRAGSDPFDGGACSGVDHYKVDVSGSVTNVDGIPGLCPEFTDTIIGATEGTPSWTQDGVNHSLSFGGGGVDDATDHILTVTAQTTGDFSLKFKPGTLSGPSFSKLGVGWWEEQDEGARRCVLYFMENGANDKWQARCRTTPDSSSSSNLFNIAGSLGDCGELRREGNDTVFLTSNGSNCNDMREQTRTPNPANTNVHVGMFITSTSAGTPASGSIEQFALSNSPDLSHTINTTTAKTVKVATVDADGNESAYGASVTQTPNSAPSGGEYKWHPGHYLLVGTGANQSQRLSSCDTSAAMAGAMEGIQVRIKWNELQNDAGAYTFTNLTNLINYCKSRMHNGQPAPQRVMLEIWWRNFAGNNTTPAPSDLIPEFVQDINGDNTGIYRTGDGWAARVWEEDVMDPLIEFYQALGAQFDSEPYFEMISTKETSAGGGASNISTYSPTAYVAQTKRLMTEIRSSWPTTIIRIMSNYITSGSQSQIKELVDHGTTTLGGFAFGGPDICPQTNCPDTWLHDVLKGEFGGHSYLGEAIIVSNAEPISFSHDMPTLYNRCINDFECSHISWMQYTGWQSNAQEAVWDNGDAQPEPDIRDYVIANPNTVSTCPSSITCNTD